MIKRFGETPSYFGLTAGFWSALQHPSPIQAAAHKHLVAIVTFIVHPIVHLDSNQELLIMLCWIDVGELQQQLPLDACRNPHS